MSRLLVRELATREDVGPGAVVAFSVTAPMPTTTEIAETILAGFDKHYRLFRETSAAAKERWERADWRAVAEASRARIDMYDTRVSEAVAAVRERFPTAGDDDALWASIKRAYIGLLYEHKQPECAETFYNSVACRVLDRRYYRNNYIFWRPAISTEHLDTEEPTYRCYYPTSIDLRETFWDIIHDFGIRSPFQDLARDLDEMMLVISEHLPQGWHPQPNFQVQVLRSLFFRNKAAYVVGRVQNGATTVPFVVPLLKDDTGRVYVDAVLLDNKDIGRLLSLGRAYFMVDMEVPSAYVEFLSSVVPSKPKAELYTLVGLQKQGKTLFFRDLQQHLRHSTDRFALAPGTKGMVMLVFTLPSFPYVFKVIRDWFEPPKDTDRTLVEGRYRYVKLHDRVGRMADTLEYSNVGFPRHRFEKTLLDELERLAKNSVEIDGDQLVVKHLYIERRLTPLDMYLRDSDDSHVTAALREYGNALRELAGANIFPGDLLLKNFGVTRYGRVVFYDYDELGELTEYRFRRLPTPRDDDDEMSAEPWFTVGPQDVFPEQFPIFLFADARARDVFLRHHADLADPRFWSAQQDRIREGVQEDLFPYSEDVRFAHRRKRPRNVVPAAPSSRTSVVPR